MRSLVAGGQRLGMFQKYCFQTSLVVRCFQTSLVVRCFQMRRLGCALFSDEAGCVVVFRRVGLAGGQRLGMFQKYCFQIRLLVVRCFQMRLVVRCFQMSLVVRCFQMQAWLCVVFRSTWLCVVFRSDWLCVVFRWRGGCGDKGRGFSGSIVFR